MFTRVFVRDMLERAISTAAQALIPLIGADALALLNLSATEIAGVSGTAALLSVLKRLAASKLNDPESASLVDLPGKHAADR